MSNVHSAVSMLFAVFTHLAAVTPPAPAQGTEGVPVLVSTEWLSSNLRDQDLIIVAVDLDARRVAYDTAHISGARFLPYAAFAQKRDGLTTELPPLVTLDSTLESIGISDRSRVVIYGPAVLSHRLFLTLDVTGFRGRVGILNGGLEAWRERGGVVSADRPPATAGKVTLRPLPGALVDRAWVRAHLNDPAVQFVDARMRARFDEARLPGAVSAPSRFLLSAGRTRGAWSLVSPDSLRSTFAASRVDLGKEAVAYCAIGETASVLYFALRSLGRSVRLYDGSLEDWTADSTAAMEKGTSGSR